MSFKPSIHHRQSIRLQDYDYSQAGAYFITICTQGREYNLGVIENGAMLLSLVGECVCAAYHDLPKRFPNISLDAFTIMPNHLHGILVITPVGAPLAAPLSTIAPITSKVAASSAPTVGEIMRAFKSLSAIAANRLLNRVGQPFWQRNYWEHVIRDENELNALREYIHHNPQQWEQDKLYVSMGAGV
ncbi:transposase [Iodobacter fluviatilis]|uniref:Transposase n=1 Tax=Iodobacter fluviatilis TaxID=537 RepID=A0A7G3G7T6_9NEIS|nr:transposase [Iodobacter fluviatilis]QBC42895.1 transposase [Iodobacter fluviatilis]